MAIRGKIHILFLISTLNGGGAERILVKLVNEICKRSDLDITVETVFGHGIYEGQIDKRVHQKTIFSGNTVTFLDRLKKRFILYFLCLMHERWLYRLFIKGHYDIEIAFIEGITSKIISGSNALQRKYAWVHTNPLLHPYSTKAYVSLSHESRCYQKFDSVFCVSDDVRSAFEQKYGVKASVLYNLQSRNFISRIHLTPCWNIR